MCRRPRARELFLIALGAMSWVCFSRSIAGEQGPGRGSRRRQTIAKTSQITRSFSIPGSATRTATWIVA
jgi:hypothetical protein